jgi:hypothetical protein
MGKLDHLKPKNIRHSILAIVATASLLVSCSNKKLETPNEATTLLKDQISRQLNNVIQANDTKIPKGASTKPPEIFNLKTKLELGQWNQEKITQLLGAAQEIKDPGKRMKFLMDEFRGSRFEYEGQSPIQPNPDELLVKLSGFDCATLTYSMLALHRSKTFDEFTINLAKIRYKNPEGLGINTNHKDGNIFDFTYNSLIQNATNERKILTNETTEILEDPLIKAHKISNRVLTIKQTEPAIGPQTVSPKYSSSGTQIESFDFIDPHSVQNAEKYIKTGDIILFARRERTDKELSNGSIDTIVGHIAFAVRGSDLPANLKIKNNIPEDSKRIYFIHASKNNEINTPSAKNKTGVDYAGIEIDTHNYDSSQPRLLSDYSIYSGFKGIAVLRPTK